MQGILTETVHVLVTALTFTNATRVRTEPAFGLLLNLAKLRFAKRFTIVVLLSRCQERLELLKVLWRGKVTRPMGHVVLETVRLLIGLITVGLRALEGFRQKKR